MAGEEKTANKVDKPKKTDEADKDSMVLTAFQTACLAIIVLNAKLIGDLLYDVFSGKSLTLQPCLLLILVSALNFCELANDWASVKKHFGQYGGVLFSIDVLTLGGFFWQVYFCSKWYNDLQIEHKHAGTELEPNVMWVVIVSYVFVYTLYAIWSAIVLFKYSEKDGCELDAVDKMDTNGDGDVDGEKNVDGRKKSDKKDAIMISALIRCGQVIVFAVSAIFIMQIKG